MLLHGRLRPRRCQRVCQHAEVELRCRTRNLARWTSGQRWVDRVAPSCDILFLQEVPSPAGLLVPPGFSGFPGGLQPLRDRGHCRSLTLIADHLVPHVRDEGFVLPELLMDYVSESVLQVMGKPSIHLLNVHASPRPVSFDETPYEAWRRPSEAHVYYSDVISSELAARVAAGKRLVAVGDFNEAYAWDDRHRTSTSEEFFSRLESLGMLDVTLRTWSSEVPTQTKHPYQVDRIFASGGTTVVMEGVEAALGEDDGLSDHLPIAFTVVP